MRSCPGPLRGRRPAVRKTLLPLLLALLVAAPLAAGCSRLAGSRGEPAGREVAGGSPAAATSPHRATGAGAGAGAGSAAGGGGAPSLPAGGRRPAPAVVRGLYLNSSVAADPARLQALLDYLHRNGLNAVVLDVKDASGRLSFPLPGTAAEALGADSRRIADPAALLRRLHGEGLYVIGRVVSFADPWAAARRPEWAIRPDGRPWTDAQGIAWLDPANRQAWAYNIAIGVAAARLGFDEIQFDEVRYPQGMPPAARRPEAERVRAVTGFLAAARREIRAAAGVPVSADVVAISAVVGDDSSIGQNYQEVAHAVDVVSPMDYPSLYGPGLFGIADPAARPYDVVRRSVAAAEARTADLPREVQRPWIQDFDLGGRRYGAREVEAELEALAAGGLRSFLLWNAASRYSEGVDFSVIDRTPPDAPSAAWLPALWSLLATRIPVALPGRVPAPPAGMSTSVRVSAAPGGYSVELWATPEPLPANDPRVAQGRLLLVVGAASQPAALAPEPSPGAAQTEVRLAGGGVARLAPSGAGVILRWDGPGRSAWVWAADAATALAAADSERVVPFAASR
ncbi:MAG: putative glycoside hydrolase [Firmicutes bacterium]|nr:putative glycoside hydrolase [Bacillota bacterium]